MRLDIVMPAHNEEDRIDRTLRAYRAACPDDGVHFIVALDSCTDRTPEIVHAHEREDDRVRSFEYPKLGKGGVIAETFARSDAELVGFVDADGATPPREMLRLADAARHVDGAIASRRHPAAMLPARRPLAREITSAGFAGSVRMLMGLPYRDTQCGAKVLRRHVVRDVLPAARLARPAVRRRPARRRARRRLARGRGPDGVDRPGGLARAARSPTRAAWALRCCGCGCGARCAGRGGPVPTPDVALISPFPALGERHGGFTGVASYSAEPRRRARPTPARA